MKKIVSFDLDGTLVSQEFGEMVWNYGIPIEYARKYGLSLDEAKNIVLSEYKSVGDGSILWYDLEYWIRRFGLDLQAKELLERYEMHIRIIDGVKEGLRKLKEKFVLIVSSNASRIFLEKELKHTDIEHFFSKVFSATSDFKMVKKEKLFYEKIMDILSVSADEMIHIGDHPVFDYEVPRSLGMEAHLVRNEKEVREILQSL